MKVKTSELKNFIKAVVRESLEEKCGGGHLAGGEKGKRMFKHIKQGYKGEKSAEDSERIAAATVNKNLKESDKKGQEKKPFQKSEIPKGQLSKFNPSIVKKSDDRKMKLPEAGLTSEEGSDHDYDEAEEVKLIKVMRHIADKLEKMHGKKSVDEEKQEKKVKCTACGKAFTPSYGEYSRCQDCLAKQLTAAEKATGVQEAAYKVTSPNETDTAKENKPLTIQTDPKVNETAYKTQGPSLKTFKDSPQFPKAVNNPKNA